MGMFGQLQPQRMSFADDSRLAAMSRLSPDDMARLMASPQSAPQPPQAAPQPQFTPQPPPGGMMQQGAPAPSPHAYDAIPQTPPSFAASGTPDLQAGPIDMGSIGFDAGTRTASMGQQMQPAPHSGGGLLGGGGFLGTIGKIGGGILDILKYGPFVAEAHANQAGRAQTRQIAYANAMTAYRNANNPTMTTLGDDLIGTPRDGGASYVAFHGQPKAGGFPQGVSAGADGIPVAAPGFSHNIPDIKAAADEAALTATRNYTEGRDDLRARRSEDRQEASFAHADTAAARREAAAELRQLRALKAIAARGGGASLVGSNPDGMPTGPNSEATLDYMLSQDLAGKTISFGGGNAGGASRRQYYAYAAQRASLNGGTGAGDFVKHASGAADVGSLKKQVAQADANTAAETTAQADLDRWLQTSKKVPMIGFRPLDSAQQSVMGMFGDTANGQAVNDMNTAMQDAHQKVTRVISNLTTGAAATDAAQRRADAIFNGGDSVAVKTGKINQLLNGMRNQIAGQTGQINATRGRISGVPRPMTPTAPPTFSHTATAPNGHKIGWNGSAWVPAQ